MDVGQHEIYHLKMLFYCDNLIILPQHMPSESVDFIYLDSQFNSSRNFHILFRDEHGTGNEAR